MVVVVVGCRVGSCGHHVCVTRVCRATTPPHCTYTHLVPPLLHDAREYVDVPRQKHVGAVDVAVHDGGAEPVDVGGPAGDVLCVFCWGVWVFGCI